MLSVGGGGEAVVYRINSCNFAERWSVLLNCGILEKLRHQTIGSDSQSEETIFKNPDRDRVKKL